MCFRNFYLYVYTTVLTVINAALSIYHSHCYTTLDFTVTVAIQCFLMPEGLSHLLQEASRRTQDNGL